MKPNKYLLILLATVLGYVVFEYYRPKPIDWTPKYQNDDKVPFGTQALFELLPGLMGQSAVKTVRLPIYNFLTETNSVQAAVNAYVKSVKDKSFPAQEHSY